MTMTLMLRRTLRTRLSCELDIRKLEKVIWLDAREDAYRYCIDGGLIAI